MALMDLSGRRFGMLTVISRAANATNTARSVRWNCRCDCGVETVVTSQSLRTGHTRSCGVHLRDGPRTHGLSKSVEYAIWWGMVTRCENPHAKTFRNYGGRGISVCQEWRRDFPAFLAHIGPRPSPKHSVDRIDTNKGYEPGNVRWADHLTQCNNRRCTRKVFYRGQETALALAVRAAGSVIHPEAAWVRIKTGWSVERALETPRLHLSGNSKERRVPASA